jgi:hypothetical protein
MNRGRRTAGLTEIDQVAIVPQHRKALRPSGSADRVENGVYAQAIRGFMNEAGQGGAVGKGRGSEGAHEFALGRGGGRAEDHHAAPLEELNEKGSHPAGGGVNQGGLPPREIRSEMA